MALNLDIAGKHIGPRLTKDYSWKDVVLYALGIGAGSSELDFCYEKNLKVIPSFAIITLYDFLPHLIEGTNINIAGMLHGEQELIFHNPIPPEGTLNTQGKIVDYFDKGADKGALVVAESDTHHSNGQKLFTSRATIFARLDGGFGGKNPPGKKMEFPGRDPDFTVDFSPSIDQPLIYRLSGDVFPLHVDPDFAKTVGFEQPIMHGLCTHGYACRALINSLIPGEPDKLRRISCRFSRPLYPGTPIQVLIWKEEEGKAVWRIINAETNEIVIDNGEFEYGEAPKKEIRFDDQVAVVTGAGGGLGRTYALELAKKGAKVVVNDLGGSRDGVGQDGSAADKVVEEIKQMGGEAVANYDSVATPEGGDNIIQTAVDAFGTVDIVINNAGILRDKSFVKMTPENWKLLIDVHLNGAYNVSKSAFNIMKEKGYGRILLTTSAAGLYGNFGQSNYSAAKMGLVGLMNTLKLEGSKYNVFVNTIAPIAVSRLTEDIFPEEYKKKLQPEMVAPLALYLVSKDCQDTGNIYNAGMGHFNRVALRTGMGIVENNIPFPEELEEQWNQIKSLEGGKEYVDLNRQIGDMLTMTSTPKSTGGQGGSKDLGGRYGTPVEVFESLPGILKEDQAAGVDVVFQFNISGANGGDWICSIQNGVCQIESGIHKSANCTLKMESEDFVAMMNQTLPSMQAYTSGKLAIEGDIMKSQLIEKLFEL